jgi:uncharacterized membrane protein YdjX (TVP38/TMEM64 family)
VAYLVADKAEDLLLTGRVAKFIGVTHKQIESFGTRLGQGSKDYFILIVLRSLPIVPSSLLSLGCGLLKVPFRLFVISTLIGSFIRDFIYIYLGYLGTTVALSFVAKTASVESLVQIIILILAFLFLGWLYFSRRK